MNTRKQQIRSVVEDVLNESLGGLIKAAAPSVLGNIAMMGAFSAIPYAVDYYYPGPTAEKSQSGNFTQSGPGQAGYAINQVDQSALRNYMDSKKF